MFKFLFFPVAQNPMQDYLQADIFSQVTLYVVIKLDQLSKEWLSKRWGFAGNTWMLIGQGLYSHLLILSLNNKHSPYNNQPLIISFLPSYTLK